MFKEQTNQAQIFQKVNIMPTNKKLLAELRNKPKKSLFKELARIEHEGYDKTKFCNPECVLSEGVCDWCIHYEFNGRKEGKAIIYTGDGKCELHGPKEPQDGKSCEDFVCFNAQKKQKENE